MLAAMIQRPRGPVISVLREMEKRRSLEARCARKQHCSGFREVTTPIFEHTELFTIKSGPNVVEEIYAFTDKGAGTSPCALSLLRR